MIRGCQIGASGPSAGGHSWSSLRPPCCHLLHICRVAICRVAISQWVLHDFVISVANGKRVQTNNQLIIGGALLEEAKEGHCCILMVACVVQDGGDAFVMDNGNVIGQRTATQ